jgi:hypothetical protein
MSKTKIHPHINAIENTNPCTGTMVNVDDLIKVVPRNSVLAYWHKQPHFNNEKLGKLVLTCPGHWTLEDIQCVLYISAKAHKKGLDTGKKDIQDNIAKVLNLKQED